MSPKALIFLLATSVLLAPAVSEAYVRTRRESDGRATAWARPRIVFTLARTTIPRGLDVADVEAAVHSALGAWDRRSIACTALELSLEDDAGTQVERDGVQRIVFRTDAWCKNGVDSPLSCYGADELAVTSVHVDKAGGSCGTAEIVEADIELNAVHYRFSTGPEQPRTGNVRNLTRVLIHELGHALGLEHNCGDGLAPDGTVPLPRCNTAGPELKSATMFPSWLEAESAGRRVGPDEERAMCDLYPRQPTVRGDADVIVAASQAAATRPRASSPLEESQLRLPWRALIALLVVGVLVHATARVTASRRHSR